MMRRRSSFRGYPTELSAIHAATAYKKPVGLQPPSFPVSRLSLCLGVLLLHFAFCMGFIGPAGKPSQLRDLLLSKPNLKITQYPIPDKFDQFYMPQFNETRRSLTVQTGYAWGASSIFWMNGNKQDDFPYLCKCDETQLQQFKDGKLQGGGGASHWWNKLEPKAPLGPACQGSSSDAVLSFNAPHCDSKNSAVALSGSFCQLALMFSIVATYMFLV